ncbi:MAG TPA: hypothetical protein VN541_06605 [Tepidisphaeraceae bacterium]|nr:hypothetical protein [Tepidisphaeraceae bacterium]
MHPAPPIPRISLDERAERETLSVHEHVARRRESFRQSISILTVGSMFLVVMLSFVSLWCIKDFAFADLKELLHILIPPIIGIVGAVTGFYFGERNMT